MCGFALSVIDPHSLRLAVTDAPVKALLCTAGTRLATAVRPRRLELGVSAAVVMTLVKWCSRQPKQAMALHHPSQGCLLA
jgi:hypothetical protein